MSLYCLGVDPGDSTGVAAFRDASLIYANQGPPDTMLTALNLILERVTTDDQAHVGCERYVSMNPRHTHQPTAQRVGGQVELIARSYQAAFAWQGPADARGIADVVLLRDLRIYQTAGDLSQRDALDANMAVRHAMLMLSRTSALTFERLLNGQADRV